MNASLKVLAIWDEAITSAEGDYVPEAADIRQMREARAAGAELMDQVASIIRYEGDPNHPASTLADNKRLLTAALARCGVVK